MLLQLCGCSDSCIDPDDFGNYVIRVPARYPLDQIFGSKTSQVVPWIDTGLYVNGYPITIVVSNWQGVAQSQTALDQFVSGAVDVFNQTINNDYSNADRTMVNRNNSREVSAWCPWYGGPSDGKVLSEICYRMRECTFGTTLPGMCNPNSEIANIKNPPCLMKKGVGLYGLIAQSGQNPNMSYVTMRNPPGKTFHVGQLYTKKDSNPPYYLYQINKAGVLRAAGGLIYNPRNFGMDGPGSVVAKGDSDNGSPGSDTWQMTGQGLDARYVNNYKLYFKILDRHYEDNSGQYIVTIKSGYKDYSVDFMESISNSVLVEIFGNRIVNTAGAVPLERDTPLSSSDGIVKKTYTTLVQNPGYGYTIRLMLLLYVVIFGIMFTIGTLKITQHQLIINISKVIVVSLLLDSRHSWDFFDTYLYGFFVDGSIYLKTLILDSSRGYDQKSLMSLIFSSQLIYKMLAVGITGFFGATYIIAYLICLLIFAFVVFETYISYLIAMILLGFIVIMAPIYISFILFGVTKNLFNIWLKQITYYTLQPMFLFLGVGILGGIVTELIYKDFGFPVCKVNILSFPDFGQFVKPSDDYDPADQSFLFWMVPRTNSASPLVPIPIPNTFIYENGVRRSIHPYSEIRNRYPDLPYLDPQNPDDKKRIDSIRSGTFIFVEDLLVLIICVALLKKYNSQAIQICQVISSTTSLVNVQSVARTSMSAMRSSVDDYVLPVASGGVRLLGAGVAKLGEGVSTLGRRLETQDQEKARGKGLNEGEGEDKVSITESARDAAAVLDKADGSKKPDAPTGDKEAKGSEGNKEAAKKGSDMDIKKDPVNRLDKFGRKLTDAGNFLKDASSYMKLKEIDNLLNMPGDLYNSLTGKIDRFGSRLKYTGINKALGLIGLTTDMEDFSKESIDFRAGINKGKQEVLNTLLENDLSVGGPMLSKITGGTQAASEAKFNQLMGNKHANTERLAKHINNILADGTKDADTKLEEVKKIVKEILKSQGKYSEGRAEKIAKQLQQRQEKAISG